jgi:hypothetical protein
MAERWVELAKPDYAYAVYERGGKNHHGHLHVLAGGKYNGGTWHDVDTAEGKLGIWRYAGNDFACTGHNWGFGTKEIVVRHFELYNPRLGVAEYISKGLVENPEYAQMWHPRRPHRRKRGRRNR